MACTDTSLTTITQVSPVLSIGQAVYITASKTYTPAIATSLQSSQVVGFVVGVTAAPNTYIIQSSGYNVGAITQDDIGAPLTPGVVFYLSKTVAGAISATNPVTGNFISKPLYVSEQISGIGTVNAGYILNQRPFDFSSIVGYDQAFAMALLFGR